MTGFLFSGGSGGGGGSLEGVFSVKSYDAVGNGIADDTIPIRNCFAAAWAHSIAYSAIAKGAEVFFPPGAYRVTSPITTLGALGSVSVRGSGQLNTLIIGDVPTGFILDKPDPGAGEIYSISNLNIVNTSLVQGSGALRFSFVGSANLENLELQGVIGLDASRDQFQNRYANIHCTGPGENQPPGSVGIAIGNATLIGCNVLGFDTGYLVGGITQGSSTGAPGSNLISCRVEVCAVGFDIGRSMIGGSQAGTILLGCQSERCTETIVLRSAGQIHIIGGAFTGTVGAGHYFHLDIGGSLVWESANGGQARLTIPSAASSLDDYGWTSGNRQVVIDSAEAIRVTIATAVWNAGTTVYTTETSLSAIGWTSGTKPIIIGQIDPPSMAIINGTGTYINSTSFSLSGVPNPGDLYNHNSPVGPGYVSTYPGYNTYPNHVTATRISARQFTYPLPVDPGGPNINTWAIWSFMQQSGLKMLGAQNGLISGTAFSIADPEVAQVDMTNFDGGFITFQSMQMGNYETGTTLGTSVTTKSLAPPAGSKKAGIKFDNCGVVSLDMTFGDLQGHPGVWLNSSGDPKEGEEYNIIDCVPATPMWSIAKGGGTGLSARRKIRFQGYIPCSLSRSGSTVTAITAVNHGLTGVNHLYIKGALQGRDRSNGILGDYNGYVDATVTGVNTFQYTISGTPVTPATGTAIQFGYWQVIG